MKTTAPAPLGSAKLADEALEPLLCVVDVARALSVNRRTLERLRAAGKLPRPDLRIGRMPRWKPETIRRWIDGQAQGRGDR